MTDVAQSVATRYRIADLVLDTGSRRVTRDGQEIELPKLSFDLFSALAAAAPDALSTDELIDKVWHGSVVNSATVAKRVELLRQALSDDSQKPRYVALVRGHGYRLVPEVTEFQAIKRSNRRNLLIVAAGVLAAAAVATWFNRPGEPEPLSNTIAVLPFESMSDNRDDEHFADGLTEELNHALAGVPGLKVTGRTSSFYYKGRNEDLRVIGETLGVAHLLEGSVRRSEDRLRVTAQLIKSADGFHLWSKTYDRSMADILDIQEDIARNVVAAMKETLFGGDDSQPGDDRPDDPYVYALYLRALGAFQQSSSTSLAIAQELLEQIVELQPGFAPAWARLANVHGRRIMAMDETYPLSREEAWLRISHANETALSLDPNNAVANANLGGVTWLMRGDAAAAAPLLERAVELDPHDTDILLLAASFAKFTRRIDQAIELEEYLVDRDPLCTGCWHSLGKSYMYGGRIDKAEQAFLTYQVIVGGGGEWNMGMLLLLKGEPEAALESFEQLDHHEYIRLQGRAMALHDLGNIGEFEKVMEELIDGWGHQWPTTVAGAYAWAGRADDAFDWLDRSIESGDLLDIQSEFPQPVFDKIRDDERWPKVMERIGRAPAQLGDFEFAVRLPD